MRKEHRTTCVIVARRLLILSFFDSVIGRRTVVIVIAIICWKIKIPLRRKGKELFVQIKKKFLREWLFLKKLMFQKINELEWFFFEFNNDDTHQKILADNVLRGDFSSLHASPSNRDVFLRRP